MPIFSVSFSLENISLSISLAVSLCLSLWPSSPLPINLFNCPFILLSFQSLPFVCFLFLLSFYPSLAVSHLLFHSVSLPFCPLPLSSSAAITEELLQLTEDKRDPSVLRGFDSPFLRTTETVHSAVAQ